MERAGHVVIETKSAEEGITAARQLDRLDVLIVNHLLHGVSGRDIADQIVARHPVMKGSRTSELMCVAGQWGSLSGCARLSSPAKAA